jgi:hypothetical protein
VQQFLVLVLLGIPAVGVCSYGFYRLAERPAIERRWPILFRNGG